MKLENENASRSAMFGIALLLFYLERSNGIIAGIYWSLFVGNWKQHCYRNYRDKL